MSITKKNLQQMTIQERQYVLEAIADTTQEYVVIEGHRLAQYQVNRITVLVKDPKKFCASVFNEPFKENMLIEVSTGKAIEVNVLQYGKNHFPSRLETRIFTSKFKDKEGLYITDAATSGMVTLYRNVVHFKQYTPGVRVAYLDLLIDKYGPLVVPARSGYCKDPVFNGVEKEVIETSEDE